MRLAGVAEKDFIPVRKVLVEQILVKGQHGVIAVQPVPLAEIFLHQAVQPVQHHTDHGLASPDGRIRLNPGQISRFWLTGEEGQEPFRVRCFQMPQKILLAVICQK